METQTESGFLVGSVDTKTLSRKERKRLLRREKLLSTRSERRQKEKVRRKEQREMLKEKGLMPPSSAYILRQTLKTRNALLSSGNLRPVRIALDLDFDGMMNFYDTLKCVKQCMHIYAMSRRTMYPIDLHFTGLKSDGAIRNGLLKNSGYTNWGITEHLDKRHTSIFAKSELIYLSSESETVLDELSPDNVYVIGGLVDHNHHKSYCHNRATEDGIRTARLPLNEHIIIKTRTVLTSFHGLLQFFQILIHYIQTQPLWK